MTQYRHKSHFTKIFPDLVDDLPFFGFIVIDKEQNPLFSAFTEDPETRQIFDALLDTRADNFAPDGTTSLRLVASDLNDVDLPTFIMYLVTGALKATIVARPLVPDGAENMTVGVAPAAATDAGAAVVETSGATVLVVFDCATVVVVVVVVVVEVVVVVVAAAAVNELLDCE